MNTQRQSSSIRNTARHDDTESDPTCFLENPDAFDLLVGDESLPRKFREQTQFVKDAITDLEDQSRSREREQHAPSRTDCLLLATLDRHVFDLRLQADQLVLQKHPLTGLITSAALAAETAADHAGVSLLVAHRTNF